jgi:PAS domain S-box-containing protein
MARKQAKRFIEDAKRIMDENIHLARYNETLRNIEKLKNKHINLVEENLELSKTNSHLKELILALNDNNRILSDQINFLEEIINSLQIIVSIKDLNRRNLLWYNQNYKRLLGYRHKELQELNSEEALNFYHPEDRRKIEERNKYISNQSQDRYSCVIRLKHINGHWIKMNSDYFVLKRNPDGSQSQAMEILTNIEMT